MKLLVLLAVTLASAEAQINVSILTGNVESPASTTVDFGRVAQSDAKELRVRLRGTSVNASLITALAITGAEFTVSDRPSLPISVNTVRPIDISIRFTAAAPASYSGILRISSTGTLNTTIVTTNITLLAVAVPAPVFNLVSGCTLASSQPPSAGLLDFSRLALNEVRSCQLSVRNPSAQAMTVSTLAVAGNGFQLTGARAPLTVPPGTTIDFGVQFSSGTKGIFAGTLTVDTRIYSLAAIVFEPSLPTPIFEFDRAAPESGQQTRLSMRFATPAATAASGFVTMTFEPTPAGITQDAGLIFVSNSSRTAAFAIGAGEAQATLNGQPFATFQTGTTSGRITFTLSGLAQGVSGEASTSVVIAPAPVGITQSTTLAGSGVPVVLALTGFDNTYSAGPMGFTFRDRSGNVIGSPIRADFTQEFKGFFARNSNGSTFRIQVWFPVTGDVRQIGAVDVEMTNSTGKTTLVPVSFP